MELYIIALLFVPLMSGIMAYVTWQQPFYYGALTQRHIWLASGGLMLFQMLEQKKVSLDEVRKVLLLLSWGFVLYLFYLNFTLDRAGFAEERAVFERFYEFKEKQGDRGFRIKLPSHFIVFGVFYYYFLSQEKARFRYFSISVLFLFSMLVVIQSRSLMVATIATMLLFSLNIRSLPQTLFRLFAAALTILLVLVLYQVYDPGMFSVMAKMFENAFTVVLTGDPGNEGSSNARIKETLLVLPYIKESWLFGSGDISYWWRGGYEALVGHFYPTDIGWIGIVYVYGIAGLVFFNQQAFFVAQYYRQLKNERNQTFIKSLFAFLTYYLIHSITNGMVGFAPYVGILFIAILANTYSVNKRNSISTTP